MKIRLIVLALAAFFIAGSVALADTPPANPADQVSQAITMRGCTAAKNPPVPLAIYLTPQGILPAAPAQYGAAMRGSCVGTPDFVQTTQPFQSAYPYPGSWWVFGVYPPQQYRGT